MMKIILPVKIKYMGLPDSMFFANSFKLKAFYGAVSNAVLWFCAPDKPRVRKMERRLL
jgi:hypothetical protein